jgi:gamma-glutamyltranspeptidase/glutathione hydrolase
MNAPLPEAERYAPRSDSHRGPVLGTRGMVATSQTHATSAGLAALRAGGNAADAAIAAAAALCVSEPTGTGLGGDCFALYYDARTRSVSALNGSGRAPRALSLERLVREGFRAGPPQFHAHTVTVPGACAGWCDLLARHGRLSLPALLAPAIELAERGFPVGPITSFLWARGVPEQLAQSEGGRELLIDGRAPRPGELFRNPTLARVLRAVAEGGSRAFYEGEIARAIAAVVQRHGGALEEADLAEHRSSWEEPASVLYRGARIWECPPNGQGLVALLALGLLEGFELAGLEPLGAQRTHLLIEALRLAFADAHEYVCDPASAPVPLHELLSPAYAEVRRKSIDPRGATLAQRAGPWGAHSPRVGSDTVYLCAVDGEGNACSFIQSNYKGFGTGLVPTGCGFPLQNRGFGFRFEPGHANSLAPGKRPYHTIMPGLITREPDQSLFGPFGVMGGFMQPQGHVQLAVALLDDGLDPQAALNRARFYLRDGAPGGSVLLEADYPQAAQRELRERGHEIALARGWERSEFGKGQAIRREADGVLWAGSEPRADGCAMPL